MTNRNQFRSPAFIKIKQNIQRVILPTHLEPCYEMIKNSTPILSADELTILREYMQVAHDLIYPVHAKEWDELLSMQHMGR